MTGIRPHKALHALAARQHKELGKCSCGSSWNVHIIAGTPYCQTCREKFSELGEGFDEQESEGEDES